jgi:hypothetical protein
MRTRFAGSLTTSTTPVPCGHRADIQILPAEESQCVARPATRPVVHKHDIVMLNGGRDACASPVLPGRRILRGYFGTPANLVAGDEGSSNSNSLTSLSPKLIRSRLIGYSPQAVTT